MAEVNVQQQPQEQQQQQVVDVKELIAQAVGVDKSIIEKVGEDTLDRVVKVVDVLARMQELPQQLRAALANFVAGRVMEEEDPTIKAIREAVKLKAILETIKPSDEKREEDGLTKELLREVIALMKEALAKRDGQEELVRKLDELMTKLSQPQTPPPQPKDPIDQLIETLEKLKKLNELLEPKRPEPFALDSLLEISEKLRKLGLDVKPLLQEAELKRLQEEAYKRGVEDGIRKAQVLAEVVGKVVDAIPKYAELLQKFPILKK